MGEERAKLVKAIEGLLEDSNSDKLIFKALSHIIPSFRRWFFLIICYFIINALFLFMFKDNITPIKDTIKIIELVDKITLPTLALAVTGYSIFQALANGDTLLTLLSVSDKEYSKFQEYNYFFLGFSMLYLILIISNFILSLILNNIEPYWSLRFLEDSTNYFFFSFLLSIYITFVIHAIIEIKSFVYNLYQIFSTNAAAKGIAHLNKEIEED